MKSCSRCLVTETMDTVGFGPDGSCSVCTQVNYKLNVVDWAARKLELDGIVSEAKARGDQYEAIIPYSGGKDSTYQLWYCVTQLKLRPLIVRYNHWSMRPQVERNNERTFKKLGVDVLDFRANWHVVKEMMREFLLRRGDQCGHCHQGVYAFPMQVAVEKRIPLVIWGESLSEYMSFLNYKEKESVDEVRFNRAMTQGIAADDLLQFLEGKIDPRDLMPFRYPAKEKLDEIGVKSICLGDYVQWRTREQVEIIKRELGWEGDAVEGVAPQYDYEKIECKQQGVRDYLKYLKRGIGRTSHLANIDIRHGHLTREEGAALAAQYDGKRPASLEWFLNMMGMTDAEFHEIALSHVVDPWEPPDLDSIEKGAPLPDMGEWV